MNTPEKKRYTIGIMLGDIQSDYSEDLISGFYTCAREEDVNLIFLMGPQAPLYCTDILLSNDNGHYHYQFDTIYDYAHFSKLDAMIIAYGSLSLSTRSSDLEQFLNNYADIPCLLLEDIPKSTDAPYLIADNYNGTRSCMEHLLDFHHYKKIAFVCGPKNNRDSNERLAAYRDTMEEHGLSVTKDMVVYGDYSENIDELVEALLDNNPGLEAIAFANDNMAKAGYRVCGRHNLLIGKDIAITGFDNVDFAQSLTPPLTSVAHSSFLFSYTALKNTLMLCRGRKPFSKRMPSVLRRRCSCGCTPNLSLTFDPVSVTDFKTFILSSADQISMDVFSLIPYENMRIYYTALVRNFFSYIYENAFEKKKLHAQDNYLFTILNLLLGHHHISTELVLEKFTELLRVLIANTEDDVISDILSDIISMLHQYTHLKDVSNLEKQVITANRKAWFVPTFTRDLINDDLNFMDSIHHVMERFRLMNIRGAYFYLFEHPIRLVAGKPISFDEDLYLTAFYNQNECHLYEPDERPLVTEQNGFSSFLPEDRRQSLTAFVMFSGEEQYGVLLCDVEQNDVSFVQTCSLQLGSLFRFIHLNNQEKKVQQELKQSLDVIQNQNHILSFISEYDELSKLLNRRGFMERAISLCKDHAGAPAHLIFGDLDHLKEINDCFGHASGDFAIQSAARLLTENLPAASLTARIGGDEFVALVLSSDPDFATSFPAKLKLAETDFNAGSAKPFFVEISVGIQSFICSPKTDLNEIIKKSDEILYEAKKHRRSSIKKA